jgi:transposase
MRIRISLSSQSRASLLDRLHRAYTLGQLRLVKRIHALLYVADNQSVADVSEILALSPQAVYNYLAAFILKGLDSLVYQRPSGRPPKLTKTQRKELADLIDAGPEAAGYDCGGWNTALLQDLILTHFGVEYNPHYVAELLKNLGYSYQKARFVSDHLDDVAAERQEWLDTTWPALRREAQARGALVLFGDECSFAQWGSLSYTWARRGQQPLVKTSGQRKAYKVFGFIEYFSGALFYKAHTGKFTSESYQAFIGDVLTRTTQHLFLIQDGARYHTSKAMQEFFAAHAERITVYPLPRYSPDFNPIEYLWRNVKKQATHLRYFPTFADLTKKVDAKLEHFADLPTAIKGLLGKYCETLGEDAA